MKKKKAPAKKKTTAKKAVKVKKASTRKPASKSAKKAAAKKKSATRKVVKKTPAKKTVAKKTVRFKAAKTSGKAAPKKTVTKKVLKKTVVKKVAAKKSAPAKKPIVKKVSPAKKKGIIKKVTVTKKPLGDIKDDLVTKVTGFATDKINSAIESQLGAVGKAVLGPVVEKGISALTDVLGLTPKQEPTDHEKVMAELAKIKQTLEELKTELVKIQNGISMLADLIKEETERINQAAKYRDYMDARDSMNAKWNTIWSIVYGITDQPTNVKRVVEAIDLYKQQTTGFVTEIQKDMSKMQNAVLKMFDDKESLFDRMARVSIEQSKESMLRGVGAKYDRDLMSLLKMHEPTIWKKLEEGPCGPAIKDPGKYYDSQHHHLLQNWYGDSWFLFMKLARPVLEDTVNNAPLTVFLAEINMMTAKALLMLTIIYRDQPGLVLPANAVIDSLNAVSANANNNFNRYSKEAQDWVAGIGKWGDAPVKKYRPMPDMMRLFGVWAAHWMHTSTNLPNACTYVENNGQYYPCQIMYNYANIKQIAETTWNRKMPSDLMMAFYVDGKKLANKTFFQKMGDTLPDWFSKLMKPKADPVKKITKLPMLKKKK